MDPEIIRMLASALDGLTEKLSMQEMLLRKVIDLLEEIKNNTM